VARTWLAANSCQGQLGPSNRWHAKITHTQTQMKRRSECDLVLQVSPKKIAMADTRHRHSHCAFNSGVSQALPWRNPPPWMKMMTGRSGGGVSGTMLGARLSGEVKVAARSGVKTFTNKQSSFVCSSLSSVICGHRVHGRSKVALRTPIHGALCSGSRGSHSNGQFCVHTESLTLADSLALTRSKPA
jgi:hypothetical protein